MTSRFSPSDLAFDADGQHVSAATDPEIYPTTAAPRFVVGDAAPTVPAATFIPEHYEPNYAYPLLVWLHDNGGSERDLLRMMPQISTRNYFGLSLRGPLEAPDGGQGFRWSPLHHDSVLLENELHEHVRRLRRKYNIHSERVFIGGSGQGAAAALQLGLRRPEWFAGMITIDGQTPRMEKPLAQYRQMQGKRILVAGGRYTNASDWHRMLGLGALLHTAGMTVCSRCHSTATEVLRDIDRWMMQECYRTVTV